MYPYPPLLAALAVGIIIAGDTYLPSLSVFYPGQRIVGAAIAIAGVALVLWATGHFRKAGTTIHPDKLKDRAADMTTLITGGPFAFSRNPIYLGMALLITGIGLGVGSLIAPLVLAGFVWFIQVRQIVPEENIMAHRFGPQWADYATHTRRWLGRHPRRIPGGGAAA